jgi:2Fe-2S ferredoxin
MSLYSLPDKNLGPQKSYTITIRNNGKEIQVDPENMPHCHDGLPGSLLAILVGSGIDIEHACGGVGGCSTCHLYVEKGFDSAPDLTDDEEFQLDFAPGVRDSSRLACLCIPSGSEDVEIEIPQWTRNEVSEDF